MKFFYVMRITVIFIIVLLSMSSCSVFKKSLRNKKSASTPVTSQVVVKEEPKPAATVKEPATKEIPIKEAEEKLLPVENKMPDPHRYFVITGSFRNPDNAKRFTSKLTREGFRPEILRSETGFYRVSVMATDDVSAARNEIRRIRSSYPEYHDTWLLIQKK